MLRRPSTLIATIASPITGCDVQFSVPVKITRRDAVPPTGISIHSPFVRHLAQFSFFIVKQFQRSPFASKNELWKTIAIQITPDGAADHPHILQHLVVSFIRLKPPFVEPKEPRTGRLRPTTGIYSSADEKFKVTVAI